VRIIFIFVERIGFIMLRSPVERDMPLPAVPPIPEPPMEPPPIPD
jgi:hypothetical protein